MKDYAGDHGLELVDEGRGLIVAALDPAELAFPDAGQLGGLEEILMNGGDQVAAGVGREEILALTADVTALEERLDDGGAGRWAAYAVFLEGVAKFLVVNELAGRLHSAEKSRLGVGFGRCCPGLLESGDVRPGLPFREVRHNPEFRAVGGAFAISL